MAFASFNSRLPKPFISCKSLAGETVRCFVLGETPYDEKLRGENDAKDCPLSCHCGDHVASLCCHPNFCRPFQCCSSAKQSEKGQSSCVSLRQRTDKAVQRCASAGKQLARVPPKEPRKTFCKIRCIGEQCCAQV